MKRALLKFCLKVILSVAALWLAFSAVPLSQVMQHMSGLNWRLVLLSVLCLHGSHLMSALRVRDSLRQVHDIRVAPRYAFWLHYVGTMFNMLLPSSIGGDGYKAWLLSRRFGQRMLTMVHLMLSNRASGLVLLFWLLAVLLLAHDGLRAALPHYTFWVLAGALGIGAAYHVAARLLWHETLRYHARMAVFSLGVQGMMLLSVWALVAAFGAPRALEYLMVMLVASIVSLLPISIGGIGLRELLMVALSPYLSFDANQAVALAAVYSLIHLSISVVGVVPYVLGHKEQEAVAG